MRSAVLWTIGFLTVFLAGTSAAPAQLPPGLPSEQAVAVLLRGASTSNLDRTGMTSLEETLENAFPIALRAREFGAHDKPTGYVRDVFGVLLEDQKVLLVGHSTGGREALRFARNQLQDGRIRVDLLVQIDRAASAATAPGNVVEAIHFWDPPQVWRAIDGGRDVNVSDLFDDDDIDHQSIDDDPRLHAMIVWLFNRSFRPNRVNLQMRESPSHRRYEGNFLQAASRSGDWPALCYSARDTLTVAGPLERDISSVDAGRPSTFHVSPETTLALHAGSEVILRPGFAAYGGSRVEIRSASACPH